MIRFPIIFLGVCRAFTCRHHRACPGDPRSGFATARKAWMAGTSARSKASSPRPAMTERGWPGHLLVVITGLVPVIHVLALLPQKGVDGRDIGAKQSFVASP